MRNGFTNLTFHLKTSLDTYTYIGNILYYTVVENPRMLGTPDLFYGPESKYFTVIL